MSQPKKYFFNEEIRGAKFYGHSLDFLSVLSVLAVYSASVALTKYNMDSTVSCCSDIFPFVIAGLFIVWYIPAITIYIIFNRMAPFMLLLAIMLLIFALFGGVSIARHVVGSIFRFWILLFRFPILPKYWSLLAQKYRCQTKRSSRIFKTAFVPFFFGTDHLRTDCAFSTHRCHTFCVCGVIMLIVGRIKMKYILLLLALGIVLLGLLVYIGQFLPDTYA